MKIVNFGKLKNSNLLSFYLYYSKNRQLPRPALLLYMIIISPSYSQEPQIPVDHLALEQGLTQLKILSIIQDHRNFAWFTVSSGLNKYESSGFTFYRPKLLNSPRRHIFYPYEIRQFTKAGITVLPQ